MVGKIFDITQVYCFVHGVSNYKCKIYGAIHCITWPGRGTKNSRTLCIIKQGFTSGKYKTLLITCPFKLIYYKINNLIDDLSSLDDDKYDH